MMKRRMRLDGKWNGQADGLGSFEVSLPGTLDTNGIGSPDEERLATRLTRLHRYEGKVRYSRQIRMPSLAGQGRLFLRIERTRELTLEIDGAVQTAFDKGTLSTPWLFEVTGYAGRNVKIVLTVDNAYTEYPRESVIGASAVTDETQTNWNGVIGDFSVYETDDLILKDLRILPTETGLEISMEADGQFPEEDGKEDLYISLESGALEEEIILPLKELTDGNKIQIRDIPLSPLCRMWDEGEGNLYALCVKIRKGKGDNPVILAERTEMFGVRTFSVDDGLRLTLNGRRFFLRGEANCAVFPEKGHPPMTEAEWEEILSRYASYGVNCMRFHSWCPPEAAFRAADRMGMMMQPELSQWNFKDAFGNKRAREYYRTELFAILRHLADHPSFVMLTFGNELQYTEEGYQFAEQLLDKARRYDRTRLYANSSNYHYGEEGTDPGSDFYTAMAYYKDMLRATSSPMIGHLNHEYPSSSHTYDQAVEKVLRDGKPLFGFEVGQYEVLPEFSEIPEFRGVTRAVNLEIVRENVRKKGLLPDWERYVEATGELSYLCYREEIEAALRTEGMSGLSLLGLQDFPGQGTALVGMLNSHLEPKPYAFAQPERFRTFFAPVVPLLYLEKYTYVSGEKLTAKVRIAHYGKEILHCEIGWKFLYNGHMIQEGIFPEASYESGGLWDAGEIELDLPETGEAKRCELRICAGEYRNSYPVWIYSGKEPEYPEGVIVSQKLTRSVLDLVESGATVFLEPESTPDNLPGSVKGQFTTDFWSVGTFPEQDGAMGMLIDPEHPALFGFPTEFYCNYQWWPMASGRPMILPDHIRPIVTVPDSYSSLRHMGLLFEAGLGKGRIMVSSMGLMEKQQYPECRELLSCLFKYLGTTAAMQNVQTITAEELLKIVAVVEESGDER